MRKGVSRKGGKLRAEEVARVRLEGQDRKGCLGRARDLAGLGDDRLMAEMHAVEIAHGDDLPSRRRQLAVMTEDAHRTRGSLSKAPRLEAWR